MKDTHFWVERELNCTLEIKANSNQPEPLRLKLYEPILVSGSDKFASLDIRISVKGGGSVAKIYAIRQAIAKALIAYYQKYVDENSKVRYLILLIN